MDTDGSSESEDYYLGVEEVIKNKEIKCFLSEKGCRDLEVK